MNHNKKDDGSSLRIVITGGSSGIGKAVALEMAKNCHRFYLTGRSEDRLKKIVRQLNSMGCEAYYGIGDVGSESDVDNLYDDMKKNLGGVDVLIANAGVGHFGLLEEVTVEQFDEQFRTNVRGVFLWLRKVVPYMKGRNRGQIIATSSGVVYRARASYSIYTSTKWAIQGMIGVLREELKGTMVKAATVNPGSVSTPWFDGRKVDRSKLLSAEDVAKAVRYIIDQSETSNLDHIYFVSSRI